MKEFIHRKKQVEENKRTAGLGLAALFVGPAREDLMLFNFYLLNNNGGVCCGVLVNKNGVFYHLFSFCVFNRNKN